jgi:hypothetical protein
MLRWSIGSRCRVQVTSNVRLPKSELVQSHRQDTHSGMNPRQMNSRQGRSVAALSKAETTDAGFTGVPTSSRPQVRGGQEFKPARFAGTRSRRETWAAQKVNQLNLPPSEQLSRRPWLRAEGRRSSPQCSEVLCWSQQSHGILEPSVKGIVMQPVAGEPNHSVNLTRNSVPHLPGMARYAHNAPLVQQVTLPRAGYLKR